MSPNLYPKRPGIINYRYWLHPLNACGGNAQFTVKPAAVIPVEEYSKSELFDWLLAQSKK
jgi:hypothetical protein